MKNKTLVAIIVILIILIFLFVYAIIYLNKSGNIDIVPPVLKTEEQKKQDRLDEVSKTLQSIQTTPAAQEDLDALQNVLLNANKENTAQPTNNTNSTSSNISNALDSQAQERANINKLLDSQ